MTRGMPHVHHFIRHSAVLIFLGCSCGGTVRVRRDVSPFEQFVPFDKVVVPLASPIAEIVRLEQIGASHDWNPWWGIPAGVVLYPLRVAVDVIAWPLVEFEELFTGRGQWDYRGNTVANPEWKSAAWDTSWLGDGEPWSPRSVK